MRPAAATVPNDELFDRYQWNLRQIDAPEAWDLTTGTPPVTIAILDTGVSLSHPDLVNKLVPGYDFVNNTAVPDDDHGNGTHVAGIAAAETNNREGIAGVAWHARVMPVKVLDAAASGDTDRAAEGVRWAVEHGARVINLGLAGPAPSSVLQEAIDLARSRGAVVIAPVASNGSAEPSYPAAQPGVIAVGATDRSDRRLPSSNTGDYISVVAPGEQIVSTFKQPDTPASYAIASTTAQAAAHVAGLAALVLSVNPVLRPDEVRAVLEASADDVGPPGRDSETGAGRINAARAVHLAAPWNFYTRGAGSYTAIPAPANTLHFPLIMKDANGWTTSVTIQNTSILPSALTVDLLDGEGRLVHSFPASLGPRASTTYDPSRLAGLPAGFVGGAVVRSSTPVSGVVNEDRSGWDRLTYEGFNAGADVVWVPLLMRHYQGWSTGIQIQNLGTAPSSVRVTYHTRTAAPPVTGTLTVAPLASRTLYQPADERLPPGWVGSAVIESLDAQPLAAIVNQVHGNGLSMSYTGIGKPGAAVFAPLLVKNSHGWNSGLQIQNAGARPLVVQATFSRSNGTDGPWLEFLPAQPGGSATFYQPASRQLPDEFVGAAAVSSQDGGAIGGIVNQVRYSSGMAMAYDAPDRGASSVFVPLVYRDFAGWNSGVQVQNLGSSATSASITFYAQNGLVAATVQSALEPGRSETHYLPSITALRSSFVGSAVVTSSSEPIAAVVNHVK